MDRELEEKVQGLKKGEQLVRTTTIEKKKKVPCPPYITVGNGISTKLFPASVVMDAFRVFSELSSAQQWLFIELKDIFVTQNISAWQKNRSMENPNLIQLDKNKLNEEHAAIKAVMGRNRNGATLEAKGVLKKVANGRYMLNPYIFIPSDDFEKVAQIWSDLNP